MEEKISSILNTLIDADIMDFKCFDILKQKLMEDPSFLESIKQGVETGMITKFPRELFDKVCDQNSREKVEPIQFFEEGLNLGNCTRTSTIISYSLDSCYICGGTLEPLIGTKNSPDGTHTWISYKKSIIDPTLMIRISEDYKNMLGYKEENRYDPNLSSVYCTAKDFANDPNFKKRGSY